MERSEPVRKPHTSTADLLTWPETSPPVTSPADSAAAAASRRSLKPAAGISAAMFGAPISDADAEIANKTKACSGLKLKEITGSGIFAADIKNGGLESGSAVSNPSNKTAIRVYQQTVSGISQISFSANESISPKKPTSLTEVAKQRELSGTMESELEAKIRKQLSEAKNKELSGHDIFGPPPEVPARPLVARNLELRGNLDMVLPQPRNIHTSVKVSNPAGGPSNIMFSEVPVTKTTKKIHDQKFQELTGNDIFKGDTPPGSSEKPLSTAKLKEMSGSDIFADVAPKEQFL
ncbi:uncharacterized protein LOC109711741 isoform X2 [Ananas comosus]|uniref:Uncharacterized protein LOC109711741 isoform X2 n=1 Tax=Ananas comosus TaxID=4615 RepID=A0A6P5FB55_ANACO|nr:uncharacterized protein LOC109711741 isoform X2 [Ananas comosus]